MIEALYKQQQKKVFFTSRFDPRESSTHKKTA